MVVITRSFGSLGKQKFSSSNDNSKAVKIPILSALALFLVGLMIISGSSFASSSSLAYAIAEEYSFVGKWGSQGSGAVQFDHPTNIATIGSSVNNDIYVADSLNSRIQKFTGDGIFVTGWGGI
jgi:hypothetical protein